MLRIGLSAALHHLDPSLPCITPSTIEQRDVTLFLVEEDAEWIYQAVRRVRPMFLSTVGEARDVLDHYRSLGCSGAPDPDVP